LKRIICTVLSLLAASAFAGPELADDVQELSPARRFRCDFCGTVQAVRRIEPGGGAPATFEFTVRLRDGSLRTSSNSTAGSWRAGDRIMLIGPAAPRE